MSSSSEIVSSHYVEEVQKNENYADAYQDQGDQGDSDQLALILLIIGIFVPCVWTINWCMHRDSLNSRAQTYAKISLILQIIETIIFVIVPVIALVSGGIFLKKAVDRAADDSD